jgi:hypothetical protein
VVILPAIRADTKDHFNYCGRGGQIGKQVKDQVYRLSQLRGPKPMYQLRRWNLQVTL